MFTLLPGCCGGISFDPGGFDGDVPAWAGPWGGLVASVFAVWAGGRRDGIDETGVGGLGVPF